MSESLSPSQARKLVLLSQRLPPARQSGRAVEASLEAIEHLGRKTGDWHAKPAKKALENLFMQGDLMAVRRVNFHKVYELTERVLPKGIDTRVPDPEEHARFLIARYLQANGLGQVAEMAYLRPGTKRLVSNVLQEMVGSGEVLPIPVGDSKWFALPESLELLDKPLARRKAKILSPFDNLVIQRKRIQALFGFDYQIECYVPAAKRRFGYFSLPILWDGKLVARVDCKVERKEEVLHVQHLALEPGLQKTDAFLPALCEELEAFMKFNGCRDLRVHRTSPGGMKGALKALVKGQD